jgi:hypothetical protein
MQRFAMRLPNLTSAFTCRLTLAIAMCAGSAASLHAADIRADNIGGAPGSGWPRSVVLEGKIEAGDYEKLKSLYGERGHNEFSLGSPNVNELSLASSGGDLAEAMKIGRLVRALKLHTNVPSQPGPHLTVGIGNTHKLKDSKANYMCASACFFIFVAGVNRTADLLADPILGIHRPYLSDIDLRTLSGDQAITSANQIRATVENYLKEMTVPAKYTDLMFSVPKDKVRWIGNADFHADLEGPIPELRDWLAARCDTRTDVERATWESLKNKSGKQLTAAERVVTDMLVEKIQEVHGCERDTLDELSADAWLQMFDPKCIIIRQDIADWELAPTEVRTFCDRQK